MDNQLLPTASGQRIRVVLGELLGRARFLAAGSFALLVGATAIGLLTAPLLGRIVDIVSGHRTAAELVTPVVALARGAGAPPGGGAPGRWAGVPRRPTDKGPHSAPERGGGPRPPPAA
ncbi:hypothetical protein ACFWX6_44075, partial [Amycolatopsis sp. NPDC059019]